MIKLHFISICGLGKLCFFIAAMVFANQSSAQVTNWPDFLNNNSAGPIFYNQDISLTGCTSISFSMQYTSDDWQPNGGVLEDVAFCGGCSGDPDDANTPACDFCWDFLDFTFSVNGSVELEQLIGTTYLITSELFVWDSGCIDAEDTYNIDLDVVSATWQNQENIDLTNVMIICNQGVAEDDVNIDPDDELCEGDNLDLSVSSTFVDADWYFESTDFLGSGTDINIDPVSIANSGEYHVETTDINGCMSSVVFDVLVEEIPIACPVVSTIEACVNSQGFAMIDLTPYDPEVNCFTSEDVLWFENQSDIPDFPIFDPTAFESDGSDIYAVVWNGLCYSTEQLVFLDVGSGLDPEIDIDALMICAGQNLIFDVINTPTCGSCTYTWDGPTGSGISDDSTPSSIYNFFGATTDQEGTWTVTVTDDTGCTGSTSVDVLVTSGPTGTISGGGDLCPGYCTDATNELTLNLSGGTAPYDVTIEVSALIFTQQFPLPAFLPNGSISLCIVDGIVLPQLGDFDGDGDDDLGIPNSPLALDFSVTLLGIEDANGCPGTGTGTINYTINPEPNANNPGGPYELCAGTMFDLTTYNNNVSGAGTILWFEDMDLNSPIANPSAYTPATSPFTVWAVVDNGTCLSEPVSLQLIVISTPVLDPIADVTVCEVYDFLVPTGTDLGGTIFYTDAAGTMFFPGGVTMAGGSYTVTAGDNPNCLDSETFEITILNQPNIVFPTSEISACGEIILPTIDVLNFDVSTGVIGYFAGPGQTGTMYSEGQTITQADAQVAGLTSIYVYVGSGVDCFQEIEIDLIFSSAIEYTLPTYPPNACGDFELLAIGGATAGVAYYSEVDGGGDQYAVGEILPAPGTYTLYLYDPTIDQICVVNPNEIFTITLAQEPTMDPVADVTVCATDGYELPIITGTFLTGEEGYATVTGGGGTTYMAGDTVFTSSTIFIYNTAASCPATELVFNVAVIPAPNAGDGDDFQTCIGPTLDLLNYLSLGADQGGSFVPADGSIILAGADNTLWDTSTADENTPYLFSYMVIDPTGVCVESTMEISIELTNDVNAGIALPDSTMCAGEMIDLFGLIDGESTGGYFLDQSNLMDTIFDGAWMSDVNTTSFNYVIEADGGCNGDQVSFDVDVVDAQLVMVDFPSDEVCEGECIEMIINTNFSTTIDIQMVDQLDYYESYDFSIDVDGSQVVEFCSDGVIGELNGNTVSIGDLTGDFLIFFTNAGSLGDCVTGISSLDEFAIEVIEAYEETIIAEVCPNEGFTYQGQEYFVDTTLDLTFAGSCDSTVIINIVELPAAENFENDTYCIGTPVTIGGNIYTENTLIDIMLPGASANGCDSIIYIDITFDNASYFDFFNTICTDEEEVINGVTYDIDNPMGADTLINGSVLGCDSIISVMLDFYSVATGVADTQTICEGDTINILGVDFYSGMEQMDVVLANQSSNNCDSIVDVSIDFFPTAEIDMEFIICEGDTLLVDGFEITEANLDGFYTLASNGIDCPTIVNYTTDVLMASIEEIDASICQGESIIINGITFDENYTFDQTSDFTVDGCDSTVTITVAIESASVSTMSELIANNEYELSVQVGDVLDSSWSTNVGSLSCENCESPTILIEEDTEIYFSATTDAGCLLADTLFLSFLPEPVFIGIYAPNVFSPDDDNINKLYTIYGTDGFVISEMSIYDRWGNRVYDTEDEFLPNNELEGWDGRINGEKAEIGVYVGRIIYLEPDGTEGVRVFDLTLIR